MLVFEEKLLDYTRAVLAEARDMNTAEIAVRLGAMLVVLRERVGDDVARQSVDAAFAQSLTASAGPLQ